MQDLHDFISSQTPHSHLIYSLRSAFPRFARKSYSDARFARILVAPLENILFTKPPVIAKKTYQATNYNQVLLYDDTSIYCGTHNFTYEYFHDARYEFEEEPCNLLNGRNVSISTLWLDLKMDFSFEMSPILDKL